MLGGGEVKCLPHKYEDNMWTTVKGDTVAHASVIPGHPHKDGDQRQECPQTLKLGGRPGLTPKVVPLPPHAHCGTMHLHGYTCTNTHTIQ